MSTKYLAGGPAHIIPEIGSNGFQAVFWTHPKNGPALKVPKIAGNPKSELFLEMMGVVRKETDIVRCHFAFSSDMPPNKIVLKIPQDWLSLREMWCCDSEYKMNMRDAYYKKLFEGLHGALWGSIFEELVIHLGQYSFQLINL